MAAKPKGRRAICKLTFGTKNYYSRVKIGTLNLLGISPESAIPAGKGNSLKRGSIRAKSYVLHLKQATDVGGVTVRSVSFPVDSRVKLKFAYVAFRKLDKIGGITSPDGVSYYWAQTASKNAGLGLPSLPSLPFDPIEIAAELGLDVAAIASFGFKKLLGAG